MKTIKTKTQYRAVGIGKIRDREFSISLSSEEPVQRSFGLEILGHDEGEVDLSRLQNKAPLLLDHDQTRVIGVIERAWVEDNQLRADVRFSKSSLAQEVVQDIEDGIRSKVSIGYRIRKMVEEQREDGLSAYRAVDWIPHEGSVVGVPADDHVGFRSEAQAEEFDTEVVQLEREEQKTETRESEAIMANDKPEIAEDVVEAPEVVETEEVREVEHVEVKEEIEHRADDLEDGISAERVRTAQIIELCNEHGMRALADDAILTGKDLDEVREIILKEKYGEPEPMKQEITLEQVTNAKDAKRYSVAKIVRAGANPRNNIDLGLEREVSDELARLNGGAPQGFYVPFNALAGRAIYDNATNGAELVQTDVMGDEFIKALRNKARVVELGAKVLTGLKGDVSIPKQNGLTTSYWLATDVTSITSESAPGLTSVTMTPKNLGAYTDISRQMLIQSEINVEMFVRDEIMSSLALAIDLAALNGSTSLAYTPTGILNTSGVNSVTMSSAAVTYAKLVQFMSEIATDNYDGSNFAFLTNAKVMGKMAQTLSSSTAAGAQYLWDIATGRTPIGRGVVSNQLTVGTANAAIFGDFSQVLIGFWGSGVDIQVDPYTQNINQKVRVVGLVTTDVAIRHPQAFSKSEDIQTT